MKHRGWGYGPALLVMAGLAGSVAAAEPPGVDQAVDRGLAYLRKLQLADGSWPRGELGATALAGLALLECRVPADDPAVRKAAQKVRTDAIPLTHTYSIALSILFLDRLGDPADGPLLESLAVRLLAGQNDVGGWTYDCPAPPESEVRRLKGLLAGRKESVLHTRPPDPQRVRRAPNDLAPEIREQLRQLNNTLISREGRGVTVDDNSNTQFACIALWVARRRGIPVERAALLLDRRFRVSQNADGGWEYKFHARSPGEERSSSAATMTCSGLLGLAVAHGVSRESTLRAVLPGSKPNTAHAAPADPARDRAVRCALYALGATIGRPIGQGKDHRRVPVLPIRGKHFYFLWSLERVAMAYGLETIGRKDWYAWGAELLVANQQPDGSWFGEYAQGGPDTCFALLFLRRSNLASDLTASLKGQVEDPGEATLKAGGVGGSALESPAAGPLSLEGPPHSPAAGNDVGRLSSDLVGARGPHQEELIEKYGKGRGSEYTDALAAAIPKLTAPVQERARVVLVERLKRMSSRTLADKLQDESPEVRRAAALASSQKDDRHNVAVLIELLRDADPSVAAAAHAALKQLSGQDFGRQDVAAWKDWWARHGGR
jgi:hypothetical protein